MVRDIHVRHPCIIAEDIYGLPGAAFAKKHLMQQDARQSASEVMGGYVFRWSKLVLELM